VNGPHDGSFKNVLDGHSELSRHQRHDIISLAAAAPGTGAAAQSNIESEANGQWTNYMTMRE
jgi:hypothetical protein